MVSLVLVTLCAAAPQTWVFKTGSRPVVSVENPGGDVIVTRSDKNEVEVEARVDRTPGQCVRYEVAVLNRAGYVTAKTFCTPCEPGLEDCPPDFKITVSVRSPKGARVTATTDSTPARRL